MFGKNFDFFREQDLDNDVASSASSVTGKEKAWHVLVKQDTGDALEGTELEKLKAAVLALAEAATGPVGGLVESLRMAAARVATCSGRSPTPGSPPCVSLSLSKSGGPCDNCGARESPQWRRGPVEVPTLCNACGTRYRRTKKLERFSESRQLCLMQKRSISRRSPPQRRSTPRRPDPKIVKIKMPGNLDARTRCSLDGNVSLLNQDHRHPWPDAVSAWVRELPVC
eukprot:jgi/Botrbrau1/17471/Bobra.0054s0058.1